MSETLKELRDLIAECRKLPTAPPKEAPANVHAAFLVRALLSVMLTWQFLVFIAVVDLIAWLGT